MEVKLKVIISYNVKYFQLLRKGSLSLDLNSKPLTQKKKVCGVTWSFMLLG